MKTRLAIIALAALLTACQNQPAPRAYGITPHGSLTRGCRYTATWGGPLVQWIDHTNGYQWTCTYREFFQYCGGRHPNALGIAVKGKLPADISSPAPATNAQPAQAQAAAYVDNPAGEIDNAPTAPAYDVPPSVLYRPVYSTPQSQR